MNPRLLLSRRLVQRISAGRNSAAVFAALLGTAFVLGPRASAQNGGRHQLAATPHVNAAPVPHPMNAPRVRIVAPPLPASGVHTPHAFPRVITRPLVNPLPSGLLGSGTRLFGGFDFGGLGPGFRPGVGFATLGCSPLWNFGCGLFGYYNYYLPYYGFEPPPKPLPAPTYSEPPPSPSYEYIIPYSYQSFLNSQAPEPEALKHSETLLYLKNGEFHLLTNYWVEDNTLHYKTADGGENTFNIEDIDVEKSMKVNASRGVSFSLHPKSNPQ